MLGDSDMHLRMTVAVLLTLGVARAQPPAQDPGSLKFEVASVKPSPPDARGGGLQLAPRKGPVQVMVIDHVEKPSPN